jgi:WD40 repeat protein
VRRTFGTHPSGEIMALSPDGRWAASSGWHSDRVRLWDAATGALAHEWTVGQKTYVYFTPDGRQLIVSRSDAYTWYDLETRRPVRTLPRDVRQFPTHVAFSPDAMLMALELAPGVMHLKDATTFRTVARLIDPHGDRAAWQGFTPDGATLITVSRDTGAVHVWDLRRIRAQLEPLNLDWDWPEFRP